MSDLKHKLSLFFESECKTLSELDVLLENTQKQKDWLDAVMLYRKGMIAIQKNDIKGLDDIRAANEALKKVVAKTPAEKTEHALKALNESITTATAEKLVESVANVKLAFSPLYVVMKQLGYNEIVNESAFYEDSCGEADQMDENTLEGDAPVTPEVAAPPTPVSDVTPEPAKEEPVAEAKKESAYEAGFNEGRKYWKKGEGHKNFLKSVVEGTLYEKPYSHVQRYSEGFAAGYAFEEEYRKDTQPEVFAEDKKEDK
jgi:hypothetical protein